MNYIDILNEFFYDYNEWRINRIFCRYAVRLIFYLKKDIEFYVNDVYSLERYKLIYAGIVFFIKDQSMWYVFIYFRLVLSEVSRGD